MRAGPISSSATTGLTADSVSASQIVDGSISADEIAAGAVGTPEVADEAVTADKLDPVTTGIYNVMAYGAVGDGTTDDSAAIQDAVDAAPNGGAVFFPPGRYRIVTTIATDTPGIVFEGVGGRSSNEADTAGYGSFIIADAGVDAIAFNSGGGLLHAGPVVRGLGFREAGAGRTSVLLSIEAANRWTVSECTFRGGATGLRLDNGENDCAWGMVEHCCFQQNNYGIDASGGVGKNVVVGGEFTNNLTAGIYILPNASNTSPMTVVGSKFDAGGPGIWTKGEALHVTGCAFEQCVPGIKVERDAALFANSGYRTSITSCQFNGSGTETGVEIGTGCRYTSLLGCGFSNLGARVTDAGTFSVRIDALDNGVDIDRTTLGVYQKFRVDGSDLVTSSVSGTTVYKQTMAPAAGKYQIVLGGNTSSDEFTVFDSTGTSQLLRVFGNGNVTIGKTNTTHTLPGYLTHTGTKAGFYGATSVTKQAVTGSRGGNAALADLLTKLATLGLITDSTSA